MTDEPMNLNDSQSANRVVIQTAVIAGIASIPVIGAGLHVALSSYLEQRKERRWRDFWNGVLEKVDNLDTRKIDTGYFSSEDFFDRIQSIYNEISTSSDKEKIGYLRNYIINCAERDGPDTSWIEIYSRHLARLTGSHLVCLQSIYRMQSQLSEMERFFRKSDRAPLDASAIMSLVGSKWDCDLVEIILTDLQSAGLVQAVSNNTNINKSGWSITNIGIKFTKFITLEGL